MEITNEIKLQVLFQYSNSEMLVSRYTPRKFKATEMFPELIQEIEDASEEFPFIYMDKYKLILKPLSSITDEDAIEVAKMINGMASIMKEKDLIGEGKYFIDECFYSNIEYYPSYVINVYQYLQSKGYDLPQYLLGGKILFEAGLAIYE